MMTTEKLIIMAKLSPSMTRTKNMSKEEFRFRYTFFKKSLDHSLACKYHTNCQVKPARNNLVSVNEKEELRAQKAFYEKIHKEMGEKKAKKLAFWRKVSLVYLPIIALTFVAVFWVLGLRNAEIL